MARTFAVLNEAWHPLQSTDVECFDVDTNKVLLTATSDTGGIASFADADLTALDTAGTRYLFRPKATRTDLGLARIQEVSNFIVPDSTGPAGPAGPTGPAGAVGATGPQGPAIWSLNFDEIDGDDTHIIPHPIVDVTIPYTWTGLHKFRHDNIGTAYVEAVHVDNSTVATALVPVQQSPYYSLGGAAWDTGSLVTRALDWRMTLVPASANPISGKLMLDFAIDGSFLNKAYLTNLGVFNVATGFTIGGAAASGNYLRGDGTNFVSNTIQAADLPGSFAGFANPTASVGLTAVNGSAATAMRSDGAPALSQAITPTWTGLHIWSGAAVRIGGTGGYLGVGSTSAPSNTTAGDITGVRLHVGTDGAFTSGFGAEVVSTRLNFSGAITITENAGGLINIGRASTHLQITNNQSNACGMAIFADLLGSGDPAPAMIFQATPKPSASIGSSYGVYALMNPQPASSITITDAVGINIINITGATAGAVTNLIGLRIQAAGISTVVPTNNIGLAIGAQAGGTNNYDVSIGTVDLTAAGAYYGRFPVLYNGLKKYIHVFS